MEAALSSLAESKGNLTFQEFLLRDTEYVLSGLCVPASWEAALLIYFMCALISMFVLANTNVYCSAICWFNQNGGKKYTHFSWYPEVLIFWSQLFLPPPQKNGGELKLIKDNLRIMTHFSYHNLHTANSCFIDAISMAAQAKTPQITQWLICDLLKVYKFK